MIYMKQFVENIIYYKIVKIDKKIDYIKINIYIFI